MSIPQTFEFQKNLRDALERWAQRYDSALNRNNPLQSGFQSLNEQNGFRAEGESLISRLKIDAGQSFSIIAKLWLKRCHKLTAHESWAFDTIKRIWPRTG